mgnify:CR=1 FL=1
MYISYFLIILVFVSKSAVKFTKLRKFYETLFIVGKVSYEHEQEQDIRELKNLNEGEESNPLRG